MSAPLDFLKIFADRLREAGLRFAITSGMACVHYGLQQTTKDSDWILAPEQMDQFRKLLESLEQEMPPWRVSYRPIFGAPLETEYMRNGWTSHISIWDRADSPEHHVDLFAKPPRVNPDELCVDEAGFASRHVVAQMKKTDRDKDWFAVDGLGLQSWLGGESWGPLHIRTAEQLNESWRQCPENHREMLAKRRPLLRFLDQDPTEDTLERLLVMERQVWQCINRERYAIFQRSWKEFYRRWRHSDDTPWPLGGPFAQQHMLLSAAVRQFGLPTDPLGQPGVGQQILQAGLKRAANLTGSTMEELNRVVPPIQELLP
jgi:hypothetical protein